MNRNDLRRVDLNLLIVFETLMHELDESGHERTPWIRLEKHDRHESYGERLVLCTG